MSRIKQLLVSVIVALVLWPAGVSASLIIQDEHPSSSPTYFNFGQSFTAEDPNVSTISVWLSDGSAAADDPDMQFTFNLYSGAGYSGSTLFTTPVTVQTGYGSTLGDWYDISVTGHSALTVGDVYTFALYSDNHRGSIHSKSNNAFDPFPSPYMGGDRYHDFDEDGIATISTTNDLAFRVVPSAAVPEPASILLLGSGLAGLVGISRKRAK